MNILIESGISIPKTTRDHICEAMGKLEIGQSFAVQDVFRGEVSECLFDHQPKRFTIRTSREVSRIWRIA